MFLALESYAHQLTGESACGKHDLFLFNGDVLPLAMNRPEIGEFLEEGLDAALAREADFRIVLMHVPPPYSDEDWHVNRVIPEESLLYRIAFPFHFS